MKRTLLYLLISALFLLSCTSESRFYSPSKTLSLELCDQNGVLNYRLWQGKELLIDSSTISIIEGSEAKITKHTKSSHNSVWQPVWGQFSQIQDRHNQIEFKLSLSGREATLYARLFDDGVAFRYKLEGYNSAEEAQLYCEYNLRGEDLLYYTAGERAPIGPIAIGALDEVLKESRVDMKLPLYIQRSDDCVIAMIESDLFSATGFNTMKCSFNSEKGMLYATNDVDLSEESLEDNTLITPWRVILVGSPSELITNSVALNLAAPCNNEDFEWITPGKTLWDWRVHGYTAPDGFKYGVDTESYIRFIDFAAENQIEYFLIDDDWYTSVTLGNIESSKALDLDRIIEHAENKGVKLLLYYDRRKGYYGDDELFPYYRSLGTYGIKYGFMHNNAAFARAAIAKSAESNLIINFHDDPVPMIGVERTSPNAITREYCHAQQDSRRAFTPETFIKMAMINSLQGTLDMNNGNFDIVGINSGVRAKSPRATGSYHSTVVSEVARCLVIHTGLLCIPDAPEAYEAKMELFEFIKAMSVGEWDESIVLNAKMAEYITTARRSGDEWFVGSVIDSAGGALSIKTDFLCDGVEYSATIYEDGADAHCTENPEAYQIRKTTIKKGDVVEAKLACGGGHAIHFKPLSK